MLPLLLGLVRPLACVVDFVPAVPMAAVAAAPATPGLLRIGDAAAKPALDPPPPPPLPLAAALGRREREGVLHPGDEEPATLFLSSKLAQDVTAPARPCLPRRDGLAAPGEEVKDVGAEHTSRRREREKLAGCAGCVLEAGAIPGNCRRRAAPSLLALEYS